MDFLHQPNNSNIQGKPCNLTPSERQALKDLAHNCEIIIRPADKGRLIVVMDTNMYIAEMKRQLSNDTLQTLLHDPTGRRNEKNKDADTPLFCILPYNPCNLLVIVMGIIKDASPMLHTYPELVCVAKKCVIVGHRRPKNVRE